jgi:hypothetical protein
VDNSFVLTQVVSRHEVSPGGKVDDAVAQHVGNGGHHVASRADRHIVGAAGDMITHISGLPVGRTSCTHSSVASRADRVVVDGTLS